MTPLFLMKKFCDPPAFSWPPYSEENDSPLLTSNQNVIMSPLFGLIFVLSCLPSCDGLFCSFFLHLFQCLLFHRHDGTCHTNWLDCLCPILSWHWAFFQFLSRQFLWECLHSHPKSTRSWIWGHPSQPSEHGWR